MIKNIKNLVLIGGMLLSCSALSSPEICEFDSIEGDIIEFTASDKPRMTDTIHSQLPVYRYFSSDLVGERPLEKKVYVGRKAVFDFSNAVIREKPKSGSDGFDITHVFVGYADNCERVFAQVREQDFTQYFDQENALYPNELNFLLEEATLGFIFHKSEKYDIASPEFAAGDYYVLPNLKHPVLFVDKHYQETISVLPFDKVSVDELQFIPFASGGVTRSDFRIKGEYKGKEGFFVGYRGALSEKDPLSGIKSSFKAAIKKNKLMYGMSLSDVLLALGLPDNTDVYNVYKTESGFKVDYNGILATQYDNVVGKVKILKYDGIPYNLVIDIKDKLKKGKQVFSQPKFKGTLEFMDW